VDECRVAVFFYGLFMDPDILAGHGIRPGTPRRAQAAGYALRIGQRATLVPAAGARAYGLVYALTHVELDRLYSQPGLEAYRPEPIVVLDSDGRNIPTTCYTLAVAPGAGEGNPQYVAKLRDVLTRLGFPQEYVRSLSSEGCG